MCEADTEVAGLHPGEFVALVSAFGDNTRRELAGLAVRSHNLARSTIEAYYPE